VEFSNPSFFEKGFVVKPTLCLTFLKSQKEKATFKPADRVFGY